MFVNFKEFLDWVAGICSSLLVVYGIYEKTVKKNMKKIDDQIKANTKRVEDLEKKHNEEVTEVREAIRSNHSKLINDNESLLKQQAMNGIIMRSLSAVTHHLVDGNHQKQLEDSAEEIDDFLFEKAKNIKE